MMQLHTVYNNLHVVELLQCHFDRLYATPMRTLSSDGEIRVLSLNLLCIRSQTLEECS